MSFVQFRFRLSFPRFPSIFCNRGKLLSLLTSSFLEGWGHHSCRVEAIIPAGWLTSSFLEGWGHHSCRVEAIIPAGFILPGGLRPSFLLSYPTHSFLDSCINIHHNRAMERWPLTPVVAISSMWPSGKSCMICCLLCCRMVLRWMSLACPSCQHSEDRPCTDTPNWSRHAFWHGSSFIMKVWMQTQSGSAVYVNSPEHSQQWCCLCGRCRPLQDDCLKLEGIPTKRWLHFFFGVLPLLNCDSTEKSDLPIQGPWPTATTPDPRTALWSNTSILVTDRKVVAASSLHLWIVSGTGLGHFHGMRRWIGCGWHWLHLMGGRELYQKWQSLVCWDSLSRF